MPLPPPRLGGQLSQESRMSLWRFAEATRLCSRENKDLTAHPAPCARITAQQYAGGSSVSFVPADRWGRTYGFAPSLHLTKGG